jgi:hypothetical protein
MAQALRVRLASLAAPAAVAFFASLGAGCGAAAKATPESVRHREHRNPQEVWWYQPSAGKEAAKNIGYVDQCLITIGDQEEVATFVYGTVEGRAATAIGYFFADGTTFTFDRQGRQQRIGLFERNRAFEQIYGKSGTFDLRPLRKSAAGSGG